MKQHPTDTQCDCILEVLKAGRSITPPNKTQGTFQQ